MHLPRFTSKEKSGGYSIYSYSWIVSNEDALLKIKDVFPPALRADVNFHGKPLSPSAIVPIYCGVFKVSSLHYLRTTLYRYRVRLKKMWHKVGKMDPSIFCPEITYGMLRIMIQVLGSRVLTFLRKLRKTVDNPWSRKITEMGSNFMIRQSNSLEGA